ncbi:MAG: leucine-rich repeat protein [Bacillota bacterium]|nr:leucine-rich repeat protein [Bacillota bacterium]
MKLKKVMSFLVVLVMLFGITINTRVVNADPLGDYTYSVNFDGTVIITKYNGSGGDVEIPLQINGKCVTAIGDWAFANCSGLTSITISNSVTSIGDSTFAFCSGLKSITIPNGVKTIAYCAFEGCSGLKSITIPNSVTTIVNDAFAGCNGLTSITIPNSVATISDKAFYYCSSLKSVYFCGNSPSKFGTYVFDECDPNFKIYYKKNAKGFTSPTWNGYNTAIYGDSRFIVNITDSNTWEPISDAAVKVGDQTAYTDDDGNAEFLGINPGTTDINITKDGYDENSYEKYNIPANNGCYFTFLDQTEQ